MVDGRELDVRMDRLGWKGTWNWARRLSGVNFWCFCLLLDQQFMLLILFFGVIASATKFSFSSVQFAFQRWSVNLWKKVVQTGTDVECLLKVYKGSLRKDWSWNYSVVFIMITLLIVVSPYFWLTSIWTCSSLSPRSYSLPLMIGKLSSPHLNNVILKLLEDFVDTFLAENNASFNLVLKIVRWP